MNRSPSTPTLRTRLADARLCLIATPGIGARPLLDAVEGALRGGVDMVQLREKRGDDAALLDLARTLRDLCRRHGALFVVNDRIDLARTIEADGVHLGQEDAPVAAAREHLGPSVLLGVSTHDAVELRGALDDAADYVGVGSLFPTATKGRFVPVGSPELLAPLALDAEEAGVPAFGIGGLDVARAEAAAAAGFRRLALCSGILGAADPEAAARAIRSALNRPA